jgi:hypothetical protein
MGFYQSIPVGATPNSGGSVLSGIPYNMKFIRHSNHPLPVHLPFLFAADGLPRLPGFLLRHQNLLLFLLY